MEEEQIKNLKTLIKLGVTKDFFFKLISHCGDGENINVNSYANYIK